MRHGRIPESSGALVSNFPVFSVPFWKTSDKAESEHELIRRAARRTVAAICGEHAHNTRGRYV